MPRYVMLGEKIVGGAHEEIPHYPLYMLESMRNKGRLLLWLEPQLAQAYN